MDPTERFSARVDAYARARPSYPDEVIDILRVHHGLEPSTASIAELGSGTGIFTRLLLHAGATVYAVEPNAEMRAEAERTLGDRPRFRSIAGRAEATTLAAASVDLVTAAQAFHWFDVEATRVETLRILRPRSRAAFVWNDRDVDGTPFLRDFEALLQTCPAYRPLQGNARTPEKFDAFFGIDGWSRHATTNAQRLDRVGLVERVMSASYAPARGTAEHRELIRELESVFDRHARGGEVQIDYTTIVIGGRPRPS